MVRRMAGGGLDEHPGSRLGGSRRKWRAEATHSARSIDIAPLGTFKNGQVHIANKDIAITVYCQERALRCAIVPKFTPHSELD